MKNVINIKTIILSASLILQPLMTFAQSSGSHGGDSRAAHFTSVIKNSISTLEFICRGSENQLKSCSGLLQLKYVAARASTLPRHTRDSDLNGPDGKPREATNDGHSVIYLDVDNWMATGVQLNSTFRRLRLAMHEISILAGLESSDRYEFSDQMLEDFLSTKVDIAVLVGRDVQTIMQRKAHLILKGATDRTGARWWPYLVAPVILTVAPVGPIIGILLITAESTLVLSSLPMNQNSPNGINNSVFGRKKGFSVEKDSQARLSLTQQCVKKMRSEFRSGVFLDDGTVQFVGKVYGCGEPYVVKNGLKEKYYISIDELSEVTTSAH